MSLLNTVRKLFAPTLNSVSPFLHHEKLNYKIYILIYNLIKSSMFYLQVPKFDNFKTAFKIL